MLPTDDKARKMIPLFTFLTQYFPDAILAMVGVSVAGNVQHNPELSPADIKWAREKSRDQMNTAQRHIWDYGTGVKRDVDGQWHLAKAAWRILAQLQLDIEEERKGEVRVNEEGIVLFPEAKPLDVLDCPVPGCVIPYPHGR